MPLRGLQESLDYLDNVVFDSRLTLDYLLAEQEGVYAVINKTCSTYINNLGEVELNIQEIYEQAKWLLGFSYPTAQTIWDSIKGYIPSITWFLRLLGPLVAVVLLLLFRPCLFNLLVRFVSSRLQQFQVRFMVAQGFQPVPLEGDPCPFRSLEQSSRDFYTSRVG